MRRALGITPLHITVASTESTLFTRMLRPAEFIPYCILMFIPTITVALLIVYHIYMHTYFPRMWRVYSRTPTHELLTYDRKCICKCFWSHRLEAACCLAVMTATVYTKHKPGLPMFVIDDVRSSAQLRNYMYVLPQHIARSVFCTQHTLIHLWPNRMVL